MPAAAKGSGLRAGTRTALRAHRRRPGRAPPRSTVRAGQPSRASISAGHDSQASGSLANRMDKNGPKHRTCRRVGAPLCGRPNCPSNKRPYPPGQHGRGRKRISEYQTRLLEKQKLRHIYRVNEKQMRGYFEKATRHTGVTGEEMIRQLECRLDTICLRLGFALTTDQARQLVSHGHVSLDGRRIDIPSAQVQLEQPSTWPGK